MGNTVRPGRPQAAASRRERKKERTHRQIFRAAIELFRVHGFAAVSVERICEAADVARGTFFLHFPSKSALLADLDRELAADVRERLRASRKSTLLECRALFDALAERAPLQADALQALLRELLSPADGTPSAGRLRDVVEEIVAGGQRRGELRRNVSVPLAAILMLVSSVALLSAVAGRSPGAALPQARNELLHALLHGLLEPKPRLVWSPDGRRRAH